MTEDLKFIIPLYILISMDNSDLLVS